MGRSPVRTAIPRLVVAAPSSGSGKTSITTGLLGALRAAGHVVSPHKVGPDYIDPGYHALAAGRVGRNLDAYLVGDDQIVPLFLHGSAGADIALVEGVMGMYDGVTGTAGFGSTAYVAGLLRAPVVLVVDATSVGRSVAATVHGFASFDPTVRIGGVILNRVASPRHESILRDALEEVGVPVLGAVGRHEGLVTPSRHLGLVPVAERSAEARATVAELTAVVSAAVDLEAVLRLARSAPDLAGHPWTAGAGGTGDRTSPTTPTELTNRPVVAVAGGPAFTFSYAETAELLTGAGADVAVFDPLVDDALPAGTQGLVVGGGFPEVHADALAANAPLRASVRALVTAGGSVAAECAGLLFLCSSLDGRPMCGAVEASAAMGPRLHLGYAEAVAVADSVLVAAGTRVHGHEFHRTVTTPGFGQPPAADAAWRWRGFDGAIRTEGFVTAALHASYLHLHWAGVPGIADRFVAACRAVPPALAFPPVRA